MKIISSIWVKFVRKNKYLEICAYLLQNYLHINNQGSGKFTKNPELMHKHFEKICENYVDKLGLDAFTGKEIFEIGTGFSRSGLLFLIKKYDVKKVYCYDRFNCIHHSELKMIHEEKLEKYLDRLVYFVGDYSSIREYIKPNSIDTILSNAVLEFVEDLDYLSRILNLISKKNAVAYHKIDLKCHNKFKHCGELYFHTFSKRMWNAMGVNVGQLSRRLADDYVRIFENNSFECTTETKTFPDKILKSAKKYLNTNKIEKYIISDLEIKCKKK